MGPFHVSREDEKTVGGNRRGGIALKIRIPKNRNAITMAYDVVMWNNAGGRNAVSCETLADATQSAKQSRTLENRTVKIADAFGTVHHWNRIVGSKSNRWIVRPVVNDVFLSPE
jgi:hypothetical protein